MTWFSHQDYFYLNYFYLNFTLLKVNYLPFFFNGLSSDCKLHNKIHQYGKCSYD